MTTLAHTLSQVLPNTVAERLKPRWHMVRDIVLFWTRRDGQFRRDRVLGDWIASRPFGHRRMEVVVRSYKELRRFAHLGTQIGDPVFEWMQRISDCETLYDVGSANGLEGFFVHHLHGSRIVFVEPFTPSVETILKTIARLGRNESFEVVHAGCDAAPGYGKLLMHEPPKPGATYNTFADVDAYCRGGRSGAPVTASEWLPSVSLDSLHERPGFPAPTHVKIDVDGFEGRVMRGAAGLLAGGIVKSWAIEINGQQNLSEIGELMKTHGYEEVAAWEHYPGYEHYTGDHIFVRKDLCEDWQKGEKPRA